MCVAIHARIVWKGNTTEVSIPGRVAIGDQLRDVDLVMVPDANIGDQVIIHSGYAIRTVTEARSVRASADRL